MLHITFAFLRRMVFSRYFILSIICGIAAHILNLGALIPQIIAGQSDIVFYYDYSLGFGSFGSILTLAPAISCGFAFWEETNQYYYRFIVTRISRKKYLSSRLLSVMLAGALSAVTIMLSLFCCLAVFLPLVENDASRIASLSQDFHSYLWLDASNVAYIVFYTILAGLNGMLWGLLSLVISTYSENMFAILASPIIASQALDIIYSLTGAPNAIQPYHLLSGYFVLGDSMPAEVGWLVVIYAVYMFPLILTFLNRARRIVYE